jgi:acyl carrier protein
MNNPDKEDILQLITLELHKVKPLLSKSVSVHDHLANDCGLESIDIVELIARIEEKFRIPIEDEELKGLTTIEKIAEFIDIRLTSNKVDGFKTLEKKYCS